ncbi:MAG: hypothetical protein KDE55_08260 [Novosphingobium sp.]|nr:hypothetical protein [Novosphingobium sp.]
MTVRDASKSARLARRMTVWAWREPRASRLLVAAGVAFAWIALSVWATVEQIRTSGADPSWPEWVGELAYAPLIYLTPNNDFFPGHDLPWQGQVARFAGPLLPALGVVWLLRRHVLEAAAGLLLKHFAHGHAVIFGKGGSADRLAIASSAEGSCVVLADPSIAGDGPRRAVLGKAGVFALSQAPWAIGKAGSCVSWSLTDTDSLAAATELVGNGACSEGDVHVRVATFETQRALRHSPGLLQSGRLRLRPVSPEGVSMRLALCDAQLVADACLREQDRVTLCLWGGSASLVWAAELALRHNWSQALGPPRVRLSLVCDPRFLRTLVDETLGFSAHAPKVFDEDCLPELACLTDASEAMDPAITRHIVDFGDDEATLSCAFRLAEDLGQALEAPPPVQPVLRSGASAARIFRETGLQFAAPILVSAEETLSRMVGRAQDETAAMLHKAYAERFGGDGIPASGRWQDIAETYVHANRAAADHITVKFWDAKHSGLDGEELVEALAVVEHRRWCAERLLDGWIPGERDNARRMHPNLVPWAELTEADRDKDRDQVRSVLEGR